MVINHQRWEIIPPLEIFPLTEPQRKAVDEEVVDVSSLPRSR